MKQLIIAVAIIFLVACKKTTVTPTPAATAVKTWKVRYEWTFKDFNNIVTYKNQPQVSAGQPYPSAWIRKTGDVAKFTLTESGDITWFAIKASDSTTGQDISLCEYTFTRQSAQRIININFTYP